MKDRDYTKEFKELSEEEIKIFPKKLSSFSGISDDEKIKLFAFYQSATYHVSVFVLYGHRAIINPFLNFYGCYVDPITWYGEATYNKFKEKVLIYLDSIK